ncbi:MAG TPA: COX15/CtaA family protein [Anaerolineales bacterium]
MDQKSTNLPGSIATWQRNLLIVAAIFTVLLIAMGGVLCVTQSIRNCPDWPGCYGSIFPPLETGPVLEYTHRVLAAVSGLLIISAAVAGVVRNWRIRWISLPPLVAIALLLLVSFFGAQVVLHGLAPGWTAVDVGSALLVVALMVSTATIASFRMNNPDHADRLVYNTTIGRLVIAATAVLFVVLVSGVLVAGKGSITACLGWPIYSWSLLQSDGHLIGSLLRLVLFAVGFVIILIVLGSTWRDRKEHPSIFNIARWLGLALVLEVIFQVLVLVFGLLQPLLIVYTVVAAALWALLVALMVRTGLTSPLT